MVFKTAITYPEPGFMSLFDDKMIETPPSKTYCEDWRILSPASDPESSQTQRLVLELTHETNSEDGSPSRTRRGLFIIQGNFFAISLDRPHKLQLPPTPPGVVPSLADVLDHVRNNDKAVRGVLDCEYRFGLLRNFQGNFRSGWRGNFLTELSTLPWQEGREECIELVPLPNGAGFRSISRVADSNAAWSRFWVVQDSSAHFEKDL
eukprot:c19595_g1_i3.p1 GENE.c19595_g1_i3~~c19595_g1_i3.p1  ORF type:complete len:206 (-),score=29.52 c19595_g1_i3:4-621(-)